MSSASKKATASKRHRSSSVDSEATTIQPKKLSSAKKRKVIKSPEPEESGGDSSVVEIVEPIPTTPVKKVCKKKAPTELDVPVQITSKQAGAVSHRIGRRLSFGSIEADDAELVMNQVPTPRPESTVTPKKRSRKPSAKALAVMASTYALNAEDSSDLPERIIVPKKRSKGVGESSKNAKLLASVSKPKKNEIRSDSDSEAEGGHRPIEVETPPLNKGKQRQLVESDDDVNDQDFPPDQEKQTTPTDWPLSDAIPMEVLNDAPPAVDAPLEELPPCTIHSFAAKNNKGDYDDGADEVDYNMRLDLETTVSDLLPKGARALTSALKFDSLSPFVNISRAPAEYTSVNGSNQLVIKGKSQLAISLITGCVTCCNLIAPATNSRGFLVKRITFLPFDDQYERFVNYLGLKFSRESLYGPFVKLTHITIGSRCKNAAGNFTSSSRSSSTPAVRLPARYFTHGKAKSSPTKTTTSQAWFTKQFPLFLDFDAEIPIYDARESGFKFDEESFESLKSLPLYQKRGSKTPNDLPHNSIVTVAHTVNAFSDRSHASASDGASAAPELILSFNIQFVILLGMVTASA